MVAVQGTQSQMEGALINCVVLDDWQDAARSSTDWSVLENDVAVHFVHEALSREVVVATLADADIVIAMRERTPFDAALFAALPRLRLLVTTGMANASIDLEAAAAHGVTVCGTHSAGSPTPELTMGLIIALARHIPDEVANVRAGGWQTTVGRDLAGTTLGIVGFGRIGTVMARYAKAFEMKALAWSPSLDDARAAAGGAEKAASLHDLLARADIVTLHVKLTAQSRGMIDAAAFAQMRKGTLFVNTSRGGLVDEAALVAALASGHLGGAAIDVCEPEPPAPDHPLRSAPNCILTPHLGYVTANNYRHYYGDALEDIRAWRAGNPVRVLIAPR